METVVYTVNEVSEMLKVSTATVRRKVEDKTFKSIRCGSRVLILVESVNEFLKGGQAQ